MKTLIGGLMACAAVVPSAALARPLPDGGVTVQEVAQELQSKGYKAEVGKDGGGDPKIVSGVDGSRFRVWFYGCESGRCASVQFETAFDLKNGVTFEKVNQWNKERRFGSAHLDDEMDPYVQYDVDFERGATTEAVANAIDVWVTVVPRFKSSLGF